LKGDPVLRRHEREAVSGARRERTADHDAGLRPWIRLKERVDSRHDVDVTGDLLIYELKLIARTPHVGSCAGDGEGLLLGIVRTATADSWRTDVLRDPWARNRSSLHDVNGCGNCQEREGESRNDVSP
jgi:hypothetical protein